jgi:hypothetical protein
MWDWPAAPNKLTIAPGEVHVWAGGSTVISEWRLRAPPGYVAAIAAEGRDWTLRLWQV